MNVLLELETKLINEINVYPLFLLKEGNKFEYQKYNE